MKMSDMRAKARAIFGPAIAEPMPKQPNGAKALQERANARPIPTYKVGGAVKKNTPPQPTAAEREADRKRREEYAKMKVTPEQAAAITRGNRAAAIEGGRYKKGGKVQTSADTAKKLATEMGGMKKGGKAKKDGLAVMIAIGSPMKGMKKPAKKMDGGVIPTDYAASKLMAAGGAGKTRKGQAPIKKAMGGKAYAEGGKPMSGMPVGYTTKDQQKTVFKEPTPPTKGYEPPVTPPTRGYEPPVKPPINVDEPADRYMPLPKGTAKAAVPPTRLPDRKKPKEPMKPVKRAQGGAGKVRKGMMTPEGQITHAMNKIRGK